jgi:hypothetical protein
MRTTRALLARTIRAAKLLARDRRVPRPLRWGAAIGLLPIPGPFDEAVLLVIAPLFWIFCREPLRDAWSMANSVHASRDRRTDGLEVEP